MAKSGQNLNNIKQSNRSLLLNLLYYNGAQSRKALAQKSELTAAAITILINELIEDGVVIETEKIIVECRPGRNEQLVDIHYKALFVIGINFGIETIEVRLLSLDSKLLYSKEINISFVDFDHVAEILAENVKGILNDHNISKMSVVGAGVTIRGIVDSENGISINSYNVLANNIHIRAVLSKKLLMPIYVDNNVRSMLRADIILRHAQSSQSTLLIKYGPGVGGALLVGQKSYLGSSCHAIELGHFCIEPDGVACICGKRGCLETLISYEALVTKAQEIFSLKQTPFLFDLCDYDKTEVTIQKIFLAYENNDIGVENIFKEMLKYFGLSISNYALLFDPEVVLLVSEVFSCKKFIDDLQKIIISFSGKQKLKFIVSSDSNKLAKFGSASIAINGFLATGAQIVKYNRITKNGSEV